MSLAGGKGMGMGTGGGNGNILMIQLKKIDLKNWVRSASKL